MNEIELLGVTVLIEGRVYNYEFKNAKIFYDPLRMSGEVDYIGETPGRNDWVKNEPEYEELKSKIEEFLVSKGLMQ